jgi:hypothetical protein
MSGLILVFDLDQTLVDSTDLMDVVLAEAEKPSPDERVIYNLIEPKLNKNLMRNVLTQAMVLRSRGMMIDAIFLLTNNSSREYVARVSAVLYQFFSLPEFLGKFQSVRSSLVGNSRFPDVATIFDYIMVRQHAARPRLVDPPKNLGDVKVMMGAIGMPLTDDATLARRVFFFDDNVSHVLSRELAHYGSPDHYIQIKGPLTGAGGVNAGFIAGQPDMSDYEPIIREFRRLSGIALPPLSKTVNKPRGTYRLLPPKTTVTLDLDPATVRTIPAPTTLGRPPLPPVSLLPPLPGRTPRLPPHLRNYALSGQSATPLKVFNPTGGRKKTHKKHKQHRKYTHKKRR